MGFLGLCVKKLRIIQSTHVVSGWSKFVKLILGKAKISKSLLNFDQFGHIRQRECHQTRVSLKGKGLLRSSGETRSQRGPGEGKGPVCSRDCEVGRGLLRKGVVIAGPL